MSRTLHGRHVVLRPATLEDRQPIFEWLAQSDVTTAMLGPPHYPEQAVPTWDEFCTDYPPHFFDGSAPTQGRCFVILYQDRAIGQINYNDFQEAAGIRRVELDLWLRSLAWCGRGLGPDSLDALCVHLFQEFNVVEFMVQPSARNPAAIRAYEKAGFQPSTGTAVELERDWGPADYPDSVYMVRRIGPRQ